MAHDVFISYASGDKSVADAVCATLELRGIRCWIAPRDVLPGLHYGEAIIDAIHECRIMVLVFSSKANLSGHIPKEIERAVSHGSTIMPLRIEDVVPAKSLDYFIGSVHWLDALTPPLEAHLQRLAGNVQTLLARGGAVTSAIASPLLPAPTAQTGLHNESYDESYNASHTGPPAPLASHGVERGAPRRSSNIVIGVLIAVILALGLWILRSTRQGSSGAEKISAPPATQTAAQVLPSPSALAALPAPAAPGVRATTPTAAVVHAVPTKSPANKESGAAARATLPLPPATATKSSPTKMAVAAGPSRNTGGNAMKLSFHQTADSTLKLVQLLGDQDNERHQATLNQTATRYSIEGAALGYSFEHQGHAYFLFDDIVGLATHWPDTIATTDAMEPDKQVPLDFLAGERNKFLHIEPRGFNMGIGAGPVAGISLGSQMYVVVRTNDPRDRTTEHSVLTKFVAPATFQPLRTVSKLPDGRFLKMSLHEQAGSAAGLPPGGPYVLMWGTGSYRESDAYLAIVPEAQFESGMGTRYFAGLSDSGEPVWSDSASDAKPFLKDGTLGDLSVTWCKDLGLWLMMYDRRSEPNGIVFSYSRTPWGPWSEPQLIFNMVENGALGKYIHNPRARPSDGVAGPVLLPRNKGDAESIRGAAYAPYVVERWTKLQGSELEVYYTMSTLNPYVVVLMKSRLQVE